MDVLFFPFLFISSVFGSMLNFMKVNCGSNVVIKMWVMSVGQGSVLHLLHQVRFPSPFFFSMVRFPSPYIRYIRVVKKMVLDCVNSAIQYNHSFNR